MILSAILNTYGKYKVMFEGLKKFAQAYRASGTCSLKKNYKCSIIANCRRKIL